MILRPARYAMHTATCYLFLGIMYSEFGDLSSGMKFYLYYSVIPAHAGIYVIQGAGFRHAPE